MKKTGVPAILGGKPIFNTLHPFTRPTLNGISIVQKKYLEIFKNGMITNSKYVEKFETKVKNHLGVKYAVALNSCTSGLMLILKALNLKGEVIIPSFTFYATGHSVLWNNLTPVLVDCDKNTYTIDPSSVEKAITPKTSAIIGVHLFGNPANVKELEKIAKKYKLKLIFDSAHGFGIRYQGKPLGSSGDAESFSLSPTKLLTTAEGGIVTTNNEELAKKIKMGRNYGDQGTYDCDVLGLSARMSELHAILGVESLKNLEKNTAKRNKLAKLYKQLLSKIPGISFQTIEDGNRSSFKDFSIYIDKDKFGLSRNELAAALTAENIMVKKFFYPPVHKQKLYAKFSNPKNKLDNTNSLSDNSLSIPLYSHMEIGDLKKVCDAICRIYANASQISKL